MGISVACILVMLMVSTLFYGASGILSNPGRQLIGFIFFVIFLGLLAMVLAMR